MAVFKCKMCGGTIEFQEGATVGVCDSCGTKQTLPRLDDDKRANLYDRANHFRRNNEFDKASAIYEQILNEDTTDAETYWSLVLCNYGIEYVEDPATHKRVPTINRVQFTSIFDDDNYKSAIKYADSNQRELYENEAKVINDIQKGILAISQKEEPFDIFICYKETDNNGRRTPDSVLANDLYHYLVQEGFKVFFARITLEDKLGSAYEPYIFAALNSAKVMVVLGTKPEYFDAVWVKNEWSRYLSLVKKSGGKKILIPAYKDMDPYDLPEEFSHLQAQDMSKLGFMQDLIRGIKKLVNVDVKRPVVNETVVIGSDNNNVKSLLERVFLFLEDGKWQDADIYCEKVLDIDPKNAYAYLGKLMADLKVNNQKGLADLAEPFDGRDNYAKVIRFADEKLESEVRGYIEHIKERNENERLNNIYDDIVKMMGTANSEVDYKEVADRFKSISGFKDADALAEQCLENAEVSLKERIYSNAKWHIKEGTISSYEKAIETLKTISGWKDSNELISICHQKIQEIKIKEEEIRIKKEENRFKIIKILKVLVPIVICFIIMLSVYNVVNMVILPSYRYKKSLAKSQVGSTVYFGTLHNKEGIEWIVLEKQNDEMLLLSKYILTGHSYHNKFENITWENSTIRKWLNLEYMNSIFSEIEQGLILEKNVINNDNEIYGTDGGNDTKDKLFLLSIDEVNKYFSNSNQRKATYKGGSSDSWWLRSPGYLQYNAASIYNPDILGEDGYNVNYVFGVRPALWVKY